MKKLILILMMLSCFYIAFAQDCYNYTRSLGISYYDKGDYTMALKQFKAAKDCPDKPDANDLDVWINKCNSSINEKIRQAEERKRREENERKKEKENSERGYMDIIGIDFKNANDGTVIDSYGSPLIADNIKYLYPRVHYNGISEHLKTIAINVKLIKPDGSLFCGTDSPSGYTYSNDVTVMPGMDNNLYLSGWGSDSEGVYSAGTYKIEIWYNGKRLYQQAFTLGGSKEVPYLKTGSAKVRFHSTGEVFSTDSKSVQVMTNCSSWSVYSKPDWCHFTKDDDVLNISCDKNRASSSRNGSIVLKAAGAENVSIQIYQLGSSTSPSDNSSKSEVKSVAWGVKAGMTASTFSTSFGETAGSILNYGYGEDREKPLYTMEAGFRAGFFIDVRLAKMLYLQPGLFYSFQRTSNKFIDSYKETFEGTPTITGMVKDSYTEKYSSSYIELPVLLSFRIFLSRKSSLDISTGPYVAYALAGKCKFSGSMDAPSLSGSDGNSYSMYADVTGKANLYKPGGSYTRQYTTGDAGTYEHEFTNKAAPYKRFDAGLSFGLTYEFSWISLTVGYDMGLVNYANEDFWKTDRLMLSDYKGEVLSDYKQRNQRLNITLGFKFNK